MTDSDSKLLLDRANISDVVYAYATGLDRREWALYRSIFLDQIEMDFHTAGIPQGTYKADDWVRNAKRLFSGFSATQHTSTNHVHDVRGDEATCISNMQAEHFIARRPDDELQSGEDRWTIGGYYTNELVREADDWKLAKVTLTVTWQVGNADVPRIAIERGRVLESKA